MKRRHETRVTSGDNDEIEITGHVTAFRRGDGPDAWHGPTPDEPSEVEDLCVSVMIAGRMTDVTDSLDAKQREAFEELLFIRADENGEADREDRAEYERERREER